MTKDIANALYGYFEALYNMNRNIITLCGLDIEFNTEEYERIVQEVIQAIPRLIPYTKKSNEECYVIRESDGLIEFSDNIPNLKVEYEAILNRNYDFLANIKALRNKLEHQMHGIHIASEGCITGHPAFDLNYIVDNKEMTLNAADFIRFAKDINNLYTGIQELVFEYVHKTAKSNYDYQRLVRYRFSDFNKIYDSDVLYLVGKALFPF
ncbi:MAG: hypothetical protein IJM61_02535 [Firmicutes bacterium]|nr:hypothetical protein [Bacillota bacterium]